MTTRNINRIATALQTYVTLELAKQDSREFYPEDRPLCQYCHEDVFACDCEPKYEQ